MWLTIHHVERVSVSVPGLWFGSLDTAGILASSLSSARCLQVNFYPRAVAWMRGEWMLLAGALSGICRFFMVASRDQLCV